MENYDGLLNGGRKETSFGKGLIFALIGSVIAVAISIFVIAVFETIWGWVFGPLLGVAISGGWSLGKGPDGAGRQIIVIILSVAGGFLGILLGITVYLYNQGVGRDLFVALDITLDVVIDDFDFWLDVLFMAGIALATAWRRFDKNNILGEEDEFTELLGDDDVEPNATKSEMEDLLNQDVPTLTIDEIWECKNCAATNRSIVNTCEYCGASK